MAENLLVLSGPNNFKLVTSNISYNGTVMKQMCFFFQNVYTLQTGADHLVQCLIGPKVIKVINSNKTNKDTHFVFVKLAHLSTHVQVGMVLGENL